MFYTKNIQTKQTTFFYKGFFCFVVPRPVQLSVDTSALGASGTATVERICTGTSELSAEGVVHEEQRVVLRGATAGTFTLRLGDGAQAATAPVSVSASASELRVALETLPLLNEVEVFASSSRGTLGKGNRHYTTVFTIFIKQKLKLNLN